MCKLYWVSAIVRYKGDKKDWLLSEASGQLSLEKAIEEIAHIKENFTVLSAWVDTFDDNNIKTTVFHECYIDPFGDIE